MVPLSKIPVRILCGGLGTRLRSVVADRPKALAPVADRPFLELQIELLRGQGARHFVLCVGHRSAQVRDEFGDGRRLGVRIDYSEEGDDLRGTGGALQLAERFFTPAAVVVNGDTYLDFDHNRLVGHHRETGAVATLTLARLPDGRRFGTVAVDASGRVTGFREKDDAAGTGWVNAGAYLLDRRLIDRIPANATASLERDVFPAAIRDGLPVAGLPSDRPFYDIGTPDDFRAFAVRYEELRA
ncbi:MAG: nucleotidyltransferase family protein, partial [Fimbriiglobus sp.]